MEQATQPVSPTASPEKTRAQQEREATEWFHDRCRAIASLCDGRPLDHLVTVHEVLTALDGTAPTLMPLTMTWDGMITDPTGDGPGETTLVPCTTSRGGRTVIALPPEERLVLGAQLLATLHPAETCTTSGCGTAAADLDASDPQMWGWISTEVAGTDGGPRWWCSALCANAAFAAAAAELAAADQAAPTAVPAEEPAPGAAPLGSSVTFAPGVTTAVDEEIAATGWAPATDAPASGGEQ